MFVYKNGWWDGNAVSSTAHRDVEMLLMSDAVADGGVLTVKRTFSQRAAMSPTTPTSIADGDKMTLSLLCPLSRRRIVLPARGVECTHMQVCVCVAHTCSYWLCRTHSQCRPRVSCSTLVVTSYTFIPKPRSASDKTRMSERSLFAGTISLTPSWLSANKWVVFVVVAVLQHSTSWNSTTLQLRHFIAVS